MQYSDSRTVSCFLEACSLVKERYDIYRNDVIETQRDSGIQGDVPCR